MLLQALREQQEKQLAEKKKREEMERQKAVEDAKKKEAEDKRKKVEEAEKLRQLILKGEQVRQMHMRQMKGIFHSFWSNGLLTHWNCKIAGEEEKVGRGKEEASSRGADEAFEGG